jgi:hypothetical protein
VEAEMRMGNDTFFVLEAVDEEREHQDMKWGEQNHLEPYWVAILGEEFGEACQAALNYHDDAVKRHGFEIPEKVYQDLRKELVQVAAVAVAWIECLDRNSGARR